MINIANIRIANIRIAAGIVATARADGGTVGGP
jgi:hypothetical protein